MNYTPLIFTVFSLLAGILLFAIWSNIYVYAQQLSSPTLSASSPSAGSSPITTISPQLKAKMCDPSNPSLKAVNTTESHICGIPKTVKPPSLPGAAPPTSAVSSSAPPSQQTVTKPTAVANVAAAPKKQQQIATTNNNNDNKTVSPSTGGAARVTMAPVSNPSNRSLSLSSPSAIAPQVKAVNQQQQQPILGINSTAGQNYTFASSSPVVASDKLMYIGYQGSSSTGDSSSSKDKSSSDTKASHGDSSSSKDKSSSHIKSSIHNDDGSKSLSSKISSIISDSFNFKHSRYSDSNDDSEESVFGDNFFGGDSFFSSDPTAEASSSSSAAAGDSGGASVASASSSTVGSGSAASSSSTASS
jgi:hypothetical protein